jgi:hypothetical protein
MVTIGSEPPHNMEELTVHFKFPRKNDKLDCNWAKISSPIGDLRIARLDDHFGQTAIAAYFQQKPVALLKLCDERDAGLPWLAIGKTSVVEAHRGFGIMPLLITAWIERSREPLLSDMRQSQDAYHMWIRMACNTKTAFKISVWHEDGAITPLECSNGAPFPDPAAGGDSTRWLANPRQR